MSNNVNVTFKVSGNELSNYIQEIQKKSDTLTASAINGAIEQTRKGKEQLKIIDDQIRAIEKKNRIEASAIRSIAFGNRELELKGNRDRYEGLRNDIYADPKLKGNDNAIQEKINAAYGREKSSEETIKNNYRENLTVAKETERQAKIQTSLSRENIEALKQTAKENVKAISSGDLKLVDVISSAQGNDEKLVAKLTEEGLREEKKKGKEGATAGGVFSSMMAVDNINKLISSAGQLTQTQNGFDLIQPASNMAGRIIGGLVGGIIGAFAGGVGAVGGAAAGAALGGGLGDSLGAYKQREAITKQDYFKALGRYKAVTGLDRDGNDAANMEQSGISITDFLSVQSETAKRRGYAADSDKTTRDAMYLDKGYGVDQGTSGSLIEMQRSAKSNNRDLAMLVGGILERGEGKIFKGGDHTFLNEFLGKFISVQKELLKTQTIVATGTTMDILSKFNGVGGEWDSRDSRSAGNISAIQSGLSNPGSDNLKALSFAALRKNMPNASIFDILAERQKGMGSPAYLKEMLGTVEKLGGDESHQQLNLSGMFPGLSLSAVRRLYQNRKELMNGSMSTEELRSKYKDDFKSQSEGNTTDLERNTAKVTNGILAGEGVKVMMDAFKDAIESSLGGAVITLNNGQGTITLARRSSIIQANTTRKAAEVKKQEANIQQRDSDLHSIGN